MFRGVYEMVLLGGMCHRALLVALAISTSTAEAYPKRADLGAIVGTVQSEYFIIRPTRAVIDDNAKISRDVPVDAHGRFRVTGLPAKRYSTTIFAISKIGLPRFGRVVSWYGGDVIVCAGRTTLFTPSPSMPPPPPFILPAPPDPSIDSSAAQVGIQVVDSHQAPIFGALIAVIGPESRNLTTEKYSSGWVYFKNLKKGNYDIRISGASIDPVVHAKALFAAGGSLDYSGNSLIEQACTR